MTTNYEMFTDKGNKALGHAVDVLIAAGVNGAFTRKELPRKIAEMCEEVAATHLEVHDTEPEYHIEDEVNKRLCEPAGWQPISRWDW